jgi:hypothetical protein
LHFGVQFCNHLALHDRRHQVLLHRLSYADA